MNETRRDDANAEKSSSRLTAVEDASFVLAAGLWLAAAVFVMLASCLSLCLSLPVVGAARLGVSWCSGSTPDG